MIVRLVLLVALLAGSPVRALASQTDPQSTPLATAEEIAEARAYADKIIEEGEAGAYFANKTDSATPEVVHLPSGMPCMFNIAQGERISIFPQSGSNIPRGDDVGCVTVDIVNGTETTVYATRWQPLPNEALLLAQTTAAIRQRWPSARAYGGPVASATLENVPAPRTAAYLVDLPRGLHVTIAMISNIGGWSYKLRFTGPHDDGDAVGFEAAIKMAHLQMAVTAD